MRIEALHHAIRREERPLAGASVAGDTISDAIYIVLVLSLLAALVFGLAQLPPSQEAPAPAAAPSLQNLAALPRVANRLDVTRQQVVVDPEGTAILSSEVEEPDSLLPSVPSRVHDVLVDTSLDLLRFELTQAGAARAAGAMASAIGAWSSSAAPGASSAGSATNGAGGTKSSELAAAALANASGSAGPSMPGAGALSDGGARSALAVVQGPAAGAAATPPPKAPTARFAVEFGPFGTAGEAEQVERQLNEAGHQTVRFRQQTGASVYAVLIERVQSIREAQALVTTLRREGFPEPMVLAAGPSYTVRVGDPVGLRGAVQLAERLRDRGHLVRVAVRPGEAVAFVIRHGNFAARREADERAEELWRLGLSNRVVRVR